MDNCALLQNKAVSQEWYRNITGIEEQRLKFVQNFFFSESAHDHRCLMLTPKKLLQSTTCFLLFTANFRRHLHLSSISKCLEVSSQEIMCSPRYCLQDKLCITTRGLTGLFFPSLQGFEMEVLTQTNVFNLLTNRPRANSKCLLLFSIDEVPKIDYLMKTFVNGNQGTIIAHARVSRIRSLELGMYREFITHGLNFSGKNLIVSSFMFMYNNGNQDDLSVFMRTLKFNPNENDVLSQTFGIILRNCDVSSTNDEECEQFMEQIVSQFFPKVKFIGIKCRTLIATHNVHNVSSNPQPPGNVIPHFLVILFHWFQQ